MLTQNLRTNFVLGGQTVRSMHQLAFELELRSKLSRCNSSQVHATPNQTQVQRKSKTFLVLRRVRLRRVRLARRAETHTGCSQSHRSLLFRQTLEGSLSGFLLLQIGM